MAMPLFIGKHTYPFESQPCIQPAQWLLTGLLTSLNLNCLTCKVKIWVSLSVQYIPAQISERVRWGITNSTPLRPPLQYKSFPMGPAVGPLHLRSSSSPLDAWIISEKCKKVFFLKNMGNQVGRVFCSKAFGPGPKSHYKHFHLSLPTCRMVMAHRSVTVYIQGLSWY